MTKKPIDYSKGFIYKLCCLDTSIKDIYIGSSVNFKQRKKSHKYRCNTPTDKYNNSYIYQFIRASGGFENWEMIIISYYPCSNKRELEREERKYFDELGATLNKNRPYITDDEKHELQLINNRKYYHKTKLNRDNENEEEPSQNSDKKN